jgi:uncharacterized membrane protein
LPALRRAQVLSLLALLLLAGGVRVYQLGKMPLWLDEQCQLSVAQAPNLGEMIERASKLGPIGRLSYLDSWIAWQLGATTRFWFRLPDAIWGVLAVWLTFELGRRWFSANAGLFAAALLSVHALHIQFSREARGYALTVVLVLLCALQLTRMMRAVRWWDCALLFALALVTVELHPATMAPLGLMVAVVAVGSFFGKARRMWLSALAVFPAMGLVFLSRREMPLLYSNLIELRHSLSWYLGDIYKALIGGYWGVSSYAIFVLVAFGIVQGMSDARTRWFTALLCAVALAAAAPIVAGFVRGMYVVSRYSLFAVPFFMLAAGHGLAALCARFKREDAGVALAPILALALLLGMWVQRRSPYDLEREKVSNKDWPTLTE